MVADGAGSRLRAALFPDHPGLEGSGEWAARALAPAGLGVGAVPGELLDHRSGERFGCMLLADGRTYWYATWSAARPVPDEPGARLAALRRRYADWHPTVGALLAATDPRRYTSPRPSGWSRRCPPSPSAASPCSATPPTP